MAFPTSLTNAVDGSTDVLAAHVNNLEAKVGINSSAVTTSHDYKLSGVTGTDKAVSKTGTETLTNKTLTAPVISLPTGIVASDIGLGNVDNTSDATKNAAAVTLTNKTLTSPVLNTPTYSTNSILNITAKASAYQSTQQLNLTDNTATQVVLDAENYDVGSNFASNAFTAPVTGYYFVSATITYVSVVANKAYKASVYVNDAEVARVTQHSALADTVAVPIAGIFAVTAGQTIKLYAIQVSGTSTVDIQNLSLYTYMMIQLMP